MNDNTSEASSPAETDQSAETGHIPSHLHFPVVGIGASAGGIGALLRFFEAMPANSGMAFVIVLHLSPKHESNLANVLQSATKMPITQVMKTIHIEKNHVYVIAPSKHLSMNDGCLQVTDSTRPRGRHIAIDLFLRTLADVHKERAISIILSGNGSDGAVGMTRIKEQGGITFAQNPADAEYDGMPRSALETGMVDVVLPVAEMPEKLIELWHNAASIRLPGSTSMSSQSAPLAIVEPDGSSEYALRDIMTILRSRTGHDFKHYKRATILRRIERRLQVNGLPDLMSYRDYLHQNTDETPALLKDMLIGVTNFFRDRETFEALERDVIPQLFESLEAESEPIRAWVAGCSTGEEAYSIAMLMFDHAPSAAQGPDTLVFATDIDERAISVGRQGVYLESILTDVPPARLRRYFTKEGIHYRIKKEVREKVLFAAHNILRDPPFSRLHLISCRNLLIYLDRDIQKDIFEMFHFALRPGGFLFLGSSESADMATKYFTPVDKKHRIYRAVPASRNSRYVPPLPLSSSDPVSFPRPLTFTEKRKPSFADLHQRLLEQYAPPSVLINREYEIVHLSGHVERFLRYVGGEPSHSLLTAVHPELRLELRTALFQAIHTNKSVEARRTRIERDGKHFYVNIITRPVHEPATSTDLVLVLFDEVEDTMGVEEYEQAKNGKDLVVTQLEEELQKTKEQLQTTIEQYETSSEELKASNEELQAINEELRSTTEELETSKEELQSINEELITVNHELKTKVDETGQTNDDLQNFIAATEIATIFVDRGMRIKRYTPPATDIFNIIASDIGRPLLDITHKLDYEMMADDATDVFDKLRFIEREVQSSNGRWYIVRLLPYRTAEDRIEGLVLTFIDITSRRKAEEDLRAGEERMRLVVTSMKDYAIITMDMEGRINGWSIGAQRIFGYSEEEAIGQLTDIIFTPEDLERGEPENERHRARSEGRAEDERWHMRKDGSRLFCSGVMTPLIDGEMRGYAKIARDLTGNKRAEIRRDKMLAYEKSIRAQAEDANRLRDEFLAVMSHELKQPLNLIHINAELLKRLPEARKSPAINRAVETIRSTVMSQAQIIDDLLDLSRIHTGKLALHRAPVQWQAIIERIIEVVQPDANAKDITLTVDLGSEEIVVDADAIRAEQMVWNLLSNALKFTPQGGRIDIRLSRSDDDTACLEVRDNGKGIDPKFLPFVFEMFHQADASTTRQHGGLGIGLALVRQLAESHGGKVDVSSDGLGKGAQFRIWLPLAEAGIPFASVESVEDPIGTLSGMRILLIDDGIETLQAFASLLETQGVLLTTATSGAEALEAAKKSSFDLIVSDIAMPGMDGYELLSKLREISNTERVPAIALTGFSRLNDVQVALEAGFAAHIGKPVMLENFIETVRAIFAMRSSLNI